MTTRSDRQTTVAIVGGGASGTILAAQLARLGVRSLLIDGSGRMGRGVAYSTTEAAHLLNVRAEGMSAWAGEPDHFAKRFEGEGGGPRGFAQRRFFATYLGEMLADAVASGCTELAEATAVSAAREGDSWKVGFADGSSIEAQVLVLGIGNQQPEALKAFADVGRRFVRNPWGADARGAVDELARTGGAALLVGTGLTMVDLVLSLDAAGHRGRIVAMSRRGLIPRAHGDFDPAPVDYDQLPGGLRGMFRWLRRRSAAVGWRAAVDSLRPYSHPLWQGLTHDEQRRFLRHARPWWDVHRHRIAPEVASIVAGMVASGRLEIVAGRIEAAREAPEGIDVEYRRRGAAQGRTETFAYAFNCTGPLHSIARSKDPLLRSLLDAGQVKPDHLGIGLEVSEDCRAGNRLWAMGPLTKGRYWEIIAVPDIREQAAAVAQDIAQELGE
ncbi:MAG: FAD/NAD(P)-binding protein [Sphingomicrobium sp.]